MQGFFQKHIKYIVLVMLLLSITDTAKAASSTFQTLFGRQGLPVYQIPNGNPKVWVQRNAVHFLKSAPDFRLIREKIDPKLSSACALGGFNQRQDKRFFVVARHQKKKVVILGYAHGKGTNLYDPKGIADITSGYLFRYDKSGKCQVFAADY